MRILADTNVIARIAQPGHHQHRAALESVELLIAQDDDPCIVPQVLYEFWAVATRPVAANGLALSPLQAEVETTKAQRIFTFLRDERAIFDQWEQLVVKHEVRGKAAHDARLVAAMLRHNVTHILTFNAQDFARYVGITVLTPGDMVRQATKR